MRAGIWQKVLRVRREATVGRLALLGGAIALLVLSGSAVAGPVGPATKLAFKTSPAGAKGGSAFTTQPVVEIEDADGNKVDSASATITLAIKSGTGTSGATLSSCGPVSTSSGTATFSGCEIDGAGASYELTATDTTGGG